MTPEPLAVLNGHQTPATGIAPVIAKGRPLPAAAEGVHTARAFTKATLAGIVTDDSDHIDDVVLVVSELVSNAVQHAVRIRNVWLDVEIFPKWTLAAVYDTDPAVYATHTETVDEELPESGRGLFIVECLAARFRWKYGLDSKAAVAAILRTGVTLTAAEEFVLDAEMAR